MTAAQPVSAAVRPGERVLLRSINGLRWAGVVVVWSFAWFDRDQLDRSQVAIVVAAAAFVFTVWSTWALHQRPALLLTPAACIVELVLGGALLAADGWALGSEHTF